VIGIRLGLACDLPYGDHGYGGRRPAVADRLIRVITTWPVAAVAVALLS
jgi:hypothetical protein